MKALCFRFGMESIKANTSSFDRTKGSAVVYRILGTSKSLHPCLRMKSLKKRTKEEWALMVWLESFWTRFR